MFTKRQLTNIEIFEDTEEQCLTHLALKTAIKQADQQQYIVYENDVVMTNKEPKFRKPAKVMVSKKRSLEAAKAYPGMKVAVHNFASATNPGGGVIRGSNAQEEAICRCSTLFFNLYKEEMRIGFYDHHRNMLKSGEMDVTYNDDCIYTPGIVVFKTDTVSPQIMPEKDWYRVDVISCAAPNLRYNPSNPMNPNSGNKAVQLSDMELFTLHVKRMRRILDIAKRENVEVIILGAFGCGAFYNSPEVVAEVMTQVIKEYSYDFKVIEFAVYCSPDHTENYDVFERKLRDVSGRS